jgi:hypothetical protein
MELVLFTMGVRHPRQLSMENWLIVADKELFHFERIKCDLASNVNTFIFITLSLVLVDFGSHSNF